jgi:hypothetical protein
MPAIFRAPAPALVPLKKDESSSKRLVYFLQGPGTEKYF